MFFIKSFVRSGFITLGNGYLRFASSHGRYWSTTSGDSTTAYSLYFAPPDVTPTFLNTRYYGFSARCLASGVVASNQNLAKAVRSGFIALNFGYLRSVGLYGIYWAAISKSTADAYYLRFVDPNVYPSYMTARYSAFSARCLASGA